MAVRLETIALEGMLPKVFASESIPPSDVWKASLTFSRGTHYLVEAASGAGKSSMCSFIYGARRDFEGKLFFNGKDTAHMKIKEWQEIRCRHIAYLPQDLMLFPELTAIANIRLKNNLTNCLSDEEIDKWLSLLGIDMRKDYPVGRMSVGQQQRVAIIRALCQPFDFILLDEPVSHLDETNNRIVADLITSVAMRHGAAIISTSVGNPLLLHDAVTLHL